MSCKMAEKIIIKNKKSAKKNVVKSSNKNVVKSSNKNVVKSSNKNVVKSSNKNVVNAPLNQSSKNIIVSGAGKVAGTVDKTKTLEKSSNGTITFLLVLAIFLVSIPFLLACTVSCLGSSLLCSVSGFSQGSVQFCEDFWLGISEASGFECGQVYDDITNFFKDIEETINNWENIVGNALTNWGGNIDTWGGNIDNWDDKVANWDNKFDKWF